jgi:hypothetical protein
VVNDNEHQETKPPAVAQSSRSDDDEPITIELDEDGQILTQLNDVEGRTAAGGNGGTSRSANIHARPQ